MGGICWFAFRAACSLTALTAVWTACVSGEPRTDPPLWDRVPRSLRDFPSVGNETLIDPWDYLQRQGMYRLLLEHSEAAMAPLGPNNTGNVLWGLALQHGWQFTTQRLRNYDPTRPWNCPQRLRRRASPSSTVLPPEGDTCISASSWWASINYSLNVVPFMAAVRAGLFVYWRKDILMLSPGGKVDGVIRGSDAQDDTKGREVDLSKTDYKHVDQDITPQNVDRENHIYKEQIFGRTQDSCSHSDCTQYCRTVAECAKLYPKSSATWTTFFELVIRLSGRREAVSPRRREDELLAAMWAAHVHSIAEALPVFADRLQYLAPPEQLFGVSWGHSVGFIAATRFSTNYNNTREKQKALPNRILRRGDHAPEIADLTPEMNRVLVTMSDLYSWDNYLEGGLTRMWTRVMCSRSGRRLGRKLMADIDATWWRSIMDLVKLIWIFIWVPCDS